MEKDLGSVEVGKLADFVIVEENPLKNLQVLYGTGAIQLNANNELFDLELSGFASLEAQCAAIADDIAYNAHDIDDGLRSGLLTLEQLDEVPLTRDILQEVQSLYPKLDPVRRGHELMPMRSMLSALTLLLMTSKSMGLKRLVKA